MEQGARPQIAMGPGSNRRLVARVLTAALAAAFSTGLLAAGAPARGDALPPTKKKGVLTIAIRLGNPGFSEGTLANPHGFSVDSAKAVAKRMGLKVRFVDYPFARIFVPEPKPYDAAFQFVTITPQRLRLVDFAAYEIASSEGVLVAKDITGPVTLARLRTLQVCAKQVTTGLAYVQDVLQPKGLVLEYPDAAQALSALSTSICDAFVFDLPALVAAKRADPSRYGAVAGRVGSTEYYGPVLPKGSPLLPALDKAITSLRREGAFRRIAQRHFGTALASTPVLR
jgi:ABC-type amino acid transport substrate-binding protein